MKTSEFVKRVRELGLDVIEETPNGITVRTMYSLITRVIVSKAVKDTLMLNTTNIELMKLCIEYAETPIHEREDVKKYVVVIPDKENESKERVYALARVGDGRIMINRPKIKDLRQNERYHLTEEEIKRNHSYLWQFAEEVE